MEIFILMLIVSKFEIFIDVIGFFFQIFMKRFRKIMDLFQNVVNEDIFLLINKLEYIERQVFIVGRKGVKEFFQWEVGRIFKFIILENVVNYKKRKRFMIE